MAKVTYNGRVKTAFDPIFAPITYGDDRQVTRTRRGIHCQIENNFDPLIVYCKCESCGYEWKMDKQRYITGTGGIGNRPNPTILKNIGIGGTGLFIGNFIDPRTADIRFPTLPADISVHFDYDPIDGKYYGNRYHQYTHLAHDTSYCATTEIKCDEDGYVHTYDFYPLTGGTGREGELDPNIVKDLYYDSVTGALKGDKNSAYLGPTVPVYVKCEDEDAWLASCANYIAPDWPPVDWATRMECIHHYPGWRLHLNTIINNHPGGSGTYGGQAVYKSQVHTHPLPRMFGGYPMACPHCCKVNFLAKWLEPNDRPNPYGDYQHVQPSDIPVDLVPVPLLNSQDEYLPWAYSNKYIKKFDFEPSTTWFVQDDVFKSHVALLIFDSNGILMDQTEFEKIRINHLTGGLTVINENAISGYVWAVKPFTEMNEYIDNIDKVCTGIIVRDHQRIKDHFNATNT